MAAWLLRLLVMSTLAIMLAVPHATAAGWRGGIGVLGDSYSDEYQYYPPDRDQARNWVEILAQTRGLDFGPLSLGSRGVPRHQGYAYNWACSGATTDDMIADGQHSGLAAQVRDGSVGLVFIFIGGNDFIRALSRDDPAQAAMEAASVAVQNVQKAITAILEASPDVKIVLATVPDIGELPEFAEPCRDGTLPRSTLRAVDAAVCRFNQEIRDRAKSDPRIAVTDLYWSTRVARMLSPQHLLVGGVRVWRNGPSNEFDHLFLADRRHIGTVAQGLMARMFIETLNSRFHADLAPLSDQEILQAATRARRESPAIAGAGGLGQSTLSP